LNTHEKVQYDVEYFRYCYNPKIPLPTLQKNVEGHVAVQRIKQIFIILQFNRNNKCVRNTFYWHFSLSDRYKYSKKS